MERTMEFLLHGLIGALLIGLVASGVTWWMEAVNWWIVIGASAGGFVLCGLFKDRAFGWLGELFWWI